RQRRGNEACHQIEKCPACRGSPRRGNGNHSCSAASDGGARLVCTGWRMDNASPAARIHTCKLSTVVHRVAAVEAHREQHLDVRNCNSRKHRCLFYRSVSHCDAEVRWPQTARNSHGTSVGDSSDSNCTWSCSNVQPK